MREDLDITYAGMEEEREPLISAQPDLAKYRKRLILSALLMLTGLFLMVRSCSGTADRAGSVATRRRQVEVAAEVMGVYLTQTQPYCKVLLLTEPRQSPDYHREVVEAARKALKSSLGRGCELLAVDAPDFEEDFRREFEIQTGHTVSKTSIWTPPLEDWFHFSVLQSVLKAHPKCTVVVSMVGLPGDLLVRPADLPGIVVLHGADGNLATMRDAFKSKLIEAMVVYQPWPAGKPPDGLKPKTQAAFIDSSAFVTSSNAAAFFAEKRVE